MCLTSGSRIIDRTSANVLGVFLCCCAKAPCPTIISPPLKATAEGIVREPILNHFIN